MFINSTHSDQKTSIKYQALDFLYKSVVADGEDAELVNSTENKQAKICVMLSYFKEQSQNKKDISRKKIYYNNIKSKWVFIEANPLARYRKDEFRLDNEFLRICLGSSYHNDSTYLEGTRKRWKMIKKKFGIVVSPWRQKGEHVLFLLNSCKHCGYSMKDTNIHVWVNESIKKIRSTGCSRRILIRFKCGPIGKVNNLKIEKHTVTFNHKGNTITYRDPLGRIGVANSQKHGLLGTLKNAWATVVYSTSACVMSIIMGVPVFCGSEHTIAYEVCNTNLKHINKPLMPCREGFFHKFSGQIWSLEEIKKGLVWKHIKKILF